VLVVLDNARDSKHIRPLLPGSPTCLVLTTSRDQLTSLIATNTARPLLLDLLEPQEANVMRPSSSASRSVSAFGSPLSSSSHDRPSRSTRHRATARNAATTSTTTASGQSEHPPHRAADPVPQREPQPQGLSARGRPEASLSCRLAPVATRSSD
jgi:hypothetical protein